MYRTQNNNKKKPRKYLTGLWKCAAALTAYAVNAAPLISKCCRRSQIKGVTHEPILHQIFTYENY